ESNGLPTAKQPISIDAIDSVQINVSNFDVTQTGYTGANVNAVTKSGTNSFHGTLSYIFRNQDLSGDRYNPTTDTFSEPLQFKETIEGFTFGGPLIKDRLFFFAAAEDYSSSRSGVTYGPIGSDLQNVGITQAQIDTAISLASRACAPGGAPTCGMDVGNSDLPSGGSLEVKDRLFKLDWNITDNQRASLRYNKTDQTEPFYRNFSATGLSLSSHWDADVKSFENAVLQVFSDWTQDLSTELKLAYRTFDKSSDLNSDLPDIGIRFTGPVPAGVTSGTRTLRMGTENSRHFNTLNTDTFDGYFGANWYLGDHELKFGGDYSRNRIYNAFQTNTKGNYTFECLSAITCANSFEAGRPLSYTATVPQAGRTLDDAAAIWGIENIGLFVQDTWTVNDNLTLLFGVRFDTPEIGEEPLFQETAAGLSTSDPTIYGVAPYGRQTGGFGYRNDVTIDGKQLFQPRFGLNYTFDTERRTQLRGGIGLFQGAAANVWLSNPFTNTGEAVQTTGCGGSLGACGVIFSNDPNNQPIVALQAPQLTVDMIDPELEQPSIWKTTLGIDHDLPWFGIVGSIDLIVSRNETAIFYQNLNVGEASRVSDTDGRSLYWNASGYNPLCYNANGTNTSIAACSGGNSVRTKARSNSSFGNAIIARPTGKGGGESVTFALSRPIQEAWGWSLAYTHTDATEVAALTSSTSSSQWGKRASFDPNEEVESNSNYRIKDRFAGTLNWRHNFFGDYKTEIGMFYEGRSGKPYSWVFFNDMNGDGVSGNDLLYIPNAPGEVLFRGGEAEEQQFWAIVSANPNLRRFTGSVVERNSTSTPWVNQFDVRISQELPGLFAKNRTVVTLDILNFSNLLNKDWGHIEEPFDVEATRRFVNYVGMKDGKYVYSLAQGVDALALRNARGESAWAAQLTLRYEF
ncbi:MAG: Oar protein, partial [Arenimonas sp.]|nr:Oar protein [Arenimonas sp.]